MRIPSTPRRVGARNKPVHFSYVSTERGQPYEAYLAGPVWWGYLHMLRPSKPCVYELTGRQLACRFCAPGAKARVAVVKGWVPLYRRNGGDAICVPVDEVQRDHLDSLACFTKVTVGREKGKGVGVFVRACLNQEPAWASSLPEYSTPADITESLINMWQLPEVFSFFCGPVAGDNGLSPAPAAPVAVVPQPVAERLTVAPVVDDVVKRLKERAKQAERNGDGAHLRSVPGV